jgi:hypothetical protein
VVAEHGTSRRRRRQRSPQELECQFHSLLPPSGIKGGFKRPANQEAKPVPSPVAGTSPNGSANIPDPAHGSFTFNCFQTNLTSNSLRLQSHAAMFGVAHTFN